MSSGCNADQTLIVAAATNGDICTTGNAAANNVSFPSTGLRIGRGIMASCDGRSGTATRPGDGWLAINGRPGFAAASWWAPMRRQARRRRRRPSS